jgi:hypothetical protein
MEERMEQPKRTISQSVEEWNRTLEKRELALPGQLSLFEAQHQPGDEVSWVNRGRPKVGIVEAVVPPGEDLAEYCERPPKRLAKRSLFGRYLVKVPGKRASYFVPKVAQIDHVKN